MKHELEVSFHSPPAFFYLSSVVSKSLLNELIKDSSFLAVDSKRVDYEDHLVGNFESGEQLAIKPHDGPMIDGFSSFNQLTETKLSLADAYVKNYYESIGKKWRKTGVTELSDMWLNIQKEGDFNPVHNHNCKTLSGLSCFVWLTFPDQVIKSSRDPNESDHQGMTYLHWGLTPAHFSETFEQPKHIGLLPTPGVIVLFPCWLEHVVYPFKGPGKRISIASNINVHLE